MNYTTFLKEVDTRLADMRKDQLSGVLRELAQDEEESKREAFIKRMDRYCIDEIETDQEMDEDELEFLTECVEQTLDNLKELKKDQAGLERYPNEDWEWYDDWHDPSEYTYEEQYGVLDELQEAVELLHECYDKEAFELGARLAEAVGGFSVPLYEEDSDYSCGSMSLRELAMYALLEADSRKLTAEGAYMILMNTKQKKRAERMLDFLNGMKETGIMLKNILDAGSQEPDLKKFLPEWIKKLGDRSDAYSENLLVEAASMLSSEEKAFGEAKKYAGTHPALYLSLLRKGKEEGRGREMMGKALEALELVPAGSGTRADIALLAAEAALDGGKRDTAVHCWMEAFRSARTPVNYLRLRLQSGKWEELYDEAGEVIKEIKDDREFQTHAALLFLDGQFQQVIDQFMNVEKGLGWSGTFMKQGLALFLMLLKRGNLEGLGMEAVVKWGRAALDFSAEAYVTGTGKTADSNLVVFPQVFEEWKKTVEVPEAFAKQLLSRMDSWISLRVDAILTEKRRNSYGECAMYVAAYGEVLQSLDRMPELGLMQQYREKYHRFRSFVDELKRFGLK